MSERHSRLLQVNGGRIHAVIQGEGPMVLLLHGFPESWYSWRHQLGALADAGYRAVAIDQRGYGQSSKYWAQDAYRIDRLVEDAVGVVAALGETQAVVVGHDWGAPVAWTSAWMRPDVFRGVVGVSVPFSGRGLVALPGSPFGERSPDELHAELAGPGRDFYQTYFGEKTRVITEIESDVRAWLRGVVYTLSGDAPPPVLQMIAAQHSAAAIRDGGLCIPHDGRMIDGLMQPETLPAWFDEADLDFFTHEFERSGFAGPLNYYANLQDSWEFLEGQQHKPLSVPAMFIGGEFDIATAWGREAIEKAGSVMPDYRGNLIVKGSGHWIQQEKPDETNAALIDFLRQLA
ncbi:alpha/beta fold hydrolase [Polycyclovorans algicola]|uniref:alpha/beta fold hydrolase n=1 Tax=Polycyclovorans algicola TaxID=616992 RepID=UPI0004A783B7|nr:alpha/beta hydrolase [Polycyclovorans algicola]